MEPTSNVVRPRDHSVGSNSSSGSGSSSTCEEERLRKLFTSCDADGDGFLDGCLFFFLNYLLVYPVIFSKYCDALTERL